MRIGGSAMLALSLDEQSITCALVETRGATRHVRKIARFETSAPLLDNPQATGEALRAFLSQHRIGSADVVAGVPARWVIAQEKDLPPTSESEARAILRLQAERMAASDAGTLVVDTAGALTAGGTKVLIVGMLAQQIEKIRTLVESARLPLEAICPTSLAAASVLQCDHAMLRLGEGGAELVQWQAGAARTLRALASARPEQAAAEMRRILTMRGQSGDVRLCHELRLDELAARALVTQTGAQAVSLDDLSARLDPAAMNGSTPAFDGSGHLPAVALGLAALQRTGLPVNFLESRLAAEKRARLGRPAYLGIAALVMVIVGIVWLWLTVQSREQDAATLVSQVDSMKDDVAAAQARLDRFRVGRTYFEKRNAYLECTRRITMAFNYDEPIWASSIVLRGENQGTLQGKSTDQRLILQLRDRLMNDKGFSNVQLLDLREAGGRGSEIAWSISFVFNPDEVQR